MLAKLKAGLAVMKAGKSVSDPALWKSRQVTATMVTAFVWGVINAAKAFGVDVPVDNETVDAIAVAILATTNLYLTYATSKKIGL